MSAARGGHLVLHPERCTKCGKCVPACKPRAIRVGSGYVYVDADACNGCLECVAVCEPRAVEARSRKPVVARGGSTGAKVVVGSRAEAKALRKQTEAAEKSAAKPAKGAAGGAIVDFRAAAVAKASKAPSGDASLAPGAVEWSPIDAVAVLSVLLLTFFAKDIALTGTPIALMPDAGRVIARVVVLGVFYGAQVGLLAFLAARHGSRLIEAFALGRVGTSGAHKAVSALWVAGLLLATRGFSIVYGMSARAAGFEPPLRAEGELARLFGAGWVGLALSIVLVVLIGPVVEELIFRGVLLSAFQGVLAGRWQTAGPWVASALTALVFAAYHFSAWLFLPTFVLGLALGWLTQSRGGLWPAIALHALYNLVPILAAFYVAT